MLGAMIERSESEHKQLTKIYTLTFHIAAPTLTARFFIILIDHFLSLF